VVTNRVLIVVEDDDGLRPALERVLAAGGFDTKSFICAEALLDAGIATSAACLVIDIRLPGISGFELLRRLDAEGARPPTILISAQDDMGTRKRVQDSGAAAFLAKPFLGSTLIAAVNRAIASP